VPTVVLAGSYHKNRSIWEYSLAVRGVHWGEYGGPLPFELCSPIDLMPLLPGFARASWKVRRLNEWLQGINEP
jgi:hypothetical protein